ncbi:MAG: hypothetical protein LKK12_07335 [Bacteroidales bacterium]|nr:hypothetical protein [Bacteroidales bacterium]MCI2134173.1 hypothetical protein [Bacteroidales bacterium]
MRRILCIIVSLATIVSCGNGNNKKAASAMDENREEALVFYGAQRCASCLAIETQAKELVKTLLQKFLQEVRRLLDITPTKACCSINCEE